MPYLTESFNNMSERLAAQFSQLEEDRQQLRTVLSSMVEGVIAVDSDQRILFANDRAGRLLDFPAARVVGRALGSNCLKADVQNIVADALKEGSDPRRELIWNGPGTRSLAVHVARLPGTAAAWGGVGFSRQYRTAASGKLAAGFRRQRFPRTQDSAVHHQGLRGNVARRCHG